MPGGRERLSSARGRQRGRCPRRGPGRRGALHAGPGLSPRRPGPAAPSSPAAEPRRRRRVRRWRPPAALNDRAVEIRDSHQRRVAALDPGNQVIARYRPRANVAGHRHVSARRAPHSRDGGAAGPSVSASVASRVSTSAHLLDARPPDPIPDLGEPLLGASRWGPNPASRQLHVGLGRPVHCRTLGSAHEGLAAQTLPPKASPGHCLMPPGGHTPS